MPVSSDRIGGDGAAGACAAQSPRRFGAMPAPDGVAFTVWAPEQPSLRLVIEGRGEWALERDDEGYFTHARGRRAAGDRYWFRMANGTLRPDPATRFQPDGPLGRVDGRRFGARTDGTTAGWPGITALHRQVLYELHVGTFTAEGTWDAAASELPALASLGVTTVEMMPVAEFDGRVRLGL